MKLFLISLSVLLFALDASAQNEYSAGEYVCTEYVMTCEDCCDIIEKLPPSIFPNPTTDFFEVRNAIDTEGVIYNSIGKRIRRVSLTGIIDVSDLSKGVYLLVNRTNTAKFVVQ